MSNSDAVFANVVVGLGQPLALDVLDEHLERDLLPASSSPKRSGERVVELQDVARLLAGELVVELPAELAGADLVQVVRRGWPRDLLAVHAWP